MSIITSILTGGSNNHQTTSEEANRIITDFISPGVVGAITSTSGVAPMTGAFAVNAQGTPNKTTTVTLGNAYITATPAGQASQTLGVKMNANYTITHADNSSGSTVYDWVYLSIDATNANNPNSAADNVTSIVVNRSTSSATDTVGAPTYNQLIAKVTLVNSFTSVTNANIADVRTPAGAPIPDGSITDAKFSSSAVVKLGSDNYVRLSKLPYQSDTTNSSQTDVLIQSGWGWVSSGGGGSSLLSESVTFPVSYTTLFTVQLTVVGTNSSADPTTIIQLTGDTAGDVLGSVEQPTLSGFIADLKLLSGTFGASQRWGYSWIAIGKK